MAIDEASEGKDQCASRRFIGGIVFAVMIAVTPFGANANPTLQQEYKNQQREWLQKEALRLAKYAKCRQALSGNSDYMALKKRGADPPILSGYLVNESLASYMKVTANPNICQFFGPYKFDQEKALPQKAGICTTVEALEKDGTNYSIVRYESCPNRAIKISRHVVAESFSRNGVSLPGPRCPSGNIIIVGDEYKCIPNRIGKSI